MGPYFHVRIRTGKPNPYTLLDLSETELEQRFLVPYRAGTSIVINGAAVQIADIERMTITTTDEPSETLRPIIREERQRDRTLSFRFADDWYIAQRGQDVTDILITAPPGSQRASDTNPIASTPNPREVFVVHGRDGRARREVFAFLRAIGLHPMEWAEAIMRTRQPNPYIGDVIDQAFTDAQAIVVLMTPDDEARLKAEFVQPDDASYERELSGQARPNVLFEAGMAMGRSRDRTVLVELGLLRPLSDLSGRHTVRLNNTTARRQEFAQRLQMAGCAVNLVGTDWHHVGDFSIDTGKA